MTWLERVRQKNFAPHTLGTDKTAKSYEAGQKNFAPYESATDKTDKRHNEDGCVSFGSPEVVAGKVFTEPVEAIIVAYQRCSLDYGLPDGTYTPGELHRARLLVKPGAVLSYRLRWPGGTPQPITGREPIKKGW
jgi:hypothetical protein